MDITASHYAVEWFEKGYNILYINEYNDRAICVQLCMHLCSSQSN